MSICKECGVEIKAGADTCPECGCPVSNINDTNIKKNSKIKVNIMPIISLIIGIAIIIIGYSVKNTTAEIETYSASNYNADYAAFGADFYTEIYGATDIIVDELNAINSSMEYVTAAPNEIANTIYYSTGMIIIALGLVTSAFSCMKIIEIK